MKPTPFLGLLCFCTLVISCKKEVKNQESLPLKTKKGIFPVMRPFENNLPKLSSNYLSTKKEAIEQFYKKNWANNTMNGGFLVAKNGQIIYEKYNGIADKEKKTTININTPIHIASVSKVITATAILKLIDAGKISLEQKVTDFIPNFPYPKVTIKTLLDHRSGMRNYAYFTNDKKIWNPHQIMSNHDVLNIMIQNHITLEYPTNTHFSYCNTNYAILALILEKVTGLDYKVAMKKIIFEPLQMKDTYVFDFDTDKNTATPSYKGNFQKYNLDFLDGIYGDKNIYSTPRDLLKLDLARHSSRFINQKLACEIYKGCSNEHKGTKNYGLGIRMINWENGASFYFHNGWWHGNTSSFITMGKERVTIIALSNKFTHNTYAVRNLAVLFGDYPFKLKDMEKEE